MKILNRITKILDVRPYQVLCRWRTGEVRLLDLEKTFHEWSEGHPDSHYTKLLQPEVFKTVRIGNGNTLVWDNIVPFEDGTFGELDLCPDVLYSLSVPVEEGVDKLSEAA